MTHSERQERLRIVNKLLAVGVEDKPTRYRLYKEQNRLRVDISREITRRVDVQLLAGLQHEREARA